MFGKILNTSEKGAAGKGWRGLAREGEREREIERERERER